MFLNNSQHEPPEVYQTLIADLARTQVPTSIMGATLVGVGAFSFNQTGSIFVLIGTICGGIATTARIVLMSAFIRRQSRNKIDQKQISRWEAGHAATIFSVASSIGTVCTVLFLQYNLHLQMLATALIFGYCAGIVARVAIRPQIAIIALTISAVPPIFAAGTWLDPAHGILAIIFSVFLLGSFDSVRHVYRTAVRQIQTQLDMAALARRDPLTSLPNRLGLNEGFTSITSSWSGSIAIHYFDLDGFKAVNDSFGHSTGDALLCALARRLQLLLPLGAIAARVGGDEFVVLQGDASRVNDAEHLARSLYAGISQPYDLFGKEVRIGVSLGYARAAVSVADLDDLLHQADQAAYSIKRMGGGVARADANRG